MIFNSGQTILVNILAIKQQTDCALRLVELIKVIRLSNNNKAGVNRRAKRTLFSLTLPIKHFLQPPMEVLLGPEEKPHAGG
jgi:hypothetical protein